MPLLNPNNVIPPPLSQAEGIPGSKVVIKNTVDGISEIILKPNDICILEKWILSRGFEIAPKGAQVKIIEYMSFGYWKCEYTVDGITQTLSIDETILIPM